MGSERVLMSRICFEVPCSRKRCGKHCARSPTARHAVIGILLKAWADLVLAERWVWQTTGILLCYLYHVTGSLGQMDH